MFFFVLFFRVAAGLWVVIFFLVLYTASDADRVKEEERDRG